MEAKVPTAALLAFLVAASAASGDDLVAQDRRGFADGLMARGLYGLALQEYASLAEAPEKEGLDVVLSRLAECQRRTGDNRAAAATCERFAREFPSSPHRFNASVTYAQALAALGDAKRASGIFDEISTEPAAPRELRLTAMYFAGESYFKSGDKNSARSRFSMLASGAGGGEVPDSVRELRDFASLYLAEIDAGKGGEGAVDGALDAYARIAAAPASPRIGAEALFKGACLAYSAKRYDEAVARFAALLSKYPGDIRIADARLTAAWANFGAGRYADAETFADAFLAHSAGAASGADKNADALYVKAASLARTGRSQDALDAFARLLSEWPESRFSANARYERLVLLFRAGRHRELLSEAATFANPPADVAPDILWLQAEAAEALGDTGRAVQFYSMLAARHQASPLAADALYRSARHLRESGSLADAAKAFRLLPLDYPDSPLVPYALYESGCCLMALGKFEDAVRDFGTIPSKYPDHALEAEAMLQKGVAQRRLGLDRDAGATFDALAAKHGGTDAAAKAAFERARIFYDAGDHAAAERLLRPLAESATATPEAKREAGFLLGLAIHAQGREDEAADLFQPLLEGAMRSKLPVDRLIWLAEFQYLRGRYAEVSDAGRELLGREISDGVRQAANILVARSQLALSNTNAAASAFRAAAESPVRTGYSSEAALRLAEILAADGDAPGARQWFSKAIDFASGEGLESVRARAYLGLAASREASGETSEALRLYLAVSLLFDGGDEVKDAMESAERLLRAEGRAAEADAIRADRIARFGEGGGQ